MTYISNDKIYDLDDKRDYKYIPSGAIHPSRVDLREYGREIENQKNTGSCVGNALVSTMELICEKEGIHVNLSRLFSYYTSRLYHSIKIEDSGTYPRTALKAAQRIGIPAEKYWEFEPSKVNTQPNKEAYSQAFKFRVDRYESLDDCKQVVNVLAKGLPVFFAMNLGKQFYYLKGDIDSHRYPPISSDNNSIGGHAMVVVGYDLDRQYFIVENSWGTGWGDNGYCAISFDTFRKDVRTMWAITEYKLLDDSLLDRLLYSIHVFYSRLFG